MKNLKQTIKMAMLTVCLMLLGAGATIATVSAKKLGEDYTLNGFPFGWIIVIVAGGVALLFMVKILKMPKGAKPTVPYTVLAILFAFGLAMVLVDTPAPTADISGLSNVKLQIEADPVTTDGLFYPDTYFNDDTNTFVVPYHANWTSDTLYEHGDNSSYSDDPRVNFTIKVDPAGYDPTDNDLVWIYYEVTDADNYIGSNSDNRILVKTDNKYQAVWTDQDGATSTIEGWTSGGVEESFTLALDLELYEAGLSQVTDAFEDMGSLSLRIHNKDNTFSETYTIQFQCTEAWGIE